MVSLLAALSLGTPALAQDSGGVALAPGLNGGPRGLARPLPFQQMPFVTAHDLQGGVTASDRRAQNQKMIARLRGDSGFLGGFSFGTPLAASRQPPPPSNNGGFFDQGLGFGPAPIIINNEGPLALTVGDGNVVQQQSATGPGPVAQQQISTAGGAGTSGGGAVNVVTRAGNILQRTPGQR
jgi:hypothetical protein